MVNPGQGFLRGFTLVELMIGLAISTFILTALMQVIVSGGASYRFLGGFSRLQEDGRYALQFIGKSVRDAGFREISGSSDGGEVGLSEFGGVFSTLRGAGSRKELVVMDNDQVVSQDMEGLVQVSNAKPATDALIIRYQGHKEKNIYDCVGGIVRNNTVVIQMMYIRNDNVLVCGVREAGTSKRISFQPLVDNVEDMQVLFGVDNNNNGVSEVNGYVNQGDYNVVSVKVALLVSSPVGVTGAKSRSFRLLDKEPYSIADGKFRKTFIHTFALRNR